MKKSSRRCDHAVALAALAALLAWPCAAFSQGNAGPARDPARDAGRGGMPEPGVSAPGFSLKDLDGAVFDLEAEKGKSPILLVFFSVFCEPCRRELAVAQKLHEKYRDAGWRVVAVSMDGAPLKGGLAGFVRQEGYAFPVLLDEPDARGTSRAGDLFGVVEVPATFVIEKGGRIAFARKGVATEEEIVKHMRPADKP